MTVLALFTSVASCGLQRKLHKPPSLGARGDERSIFTLVEQMLRIEERSPHQFPAEQCGGYPGIVSHRDERVLTVLKADNHPGIEQSPHSSDSIHFRQSALG